MSRRNNDGQHLRHIRCNQCGFICRRDEDLTLVGQGEDTHSACPECRTDAFLQDVFEGDQSFPDLMRTELALQDNLATSIPMFCVFEVVQARLPHAPDIDEDRPGERVRDPHRQLFRHVVVTSDHDSEITGDEAKKYLEAIDQDETTFVYEDEVGSECRGDVECYEMETWMQYARFCTACFTKLGADEYIRANGHNLKDPFVYVASGYRNREWELLRKYLQSGDLDKTWRALQPLISDDPTVNAWMKSGQDVRMLIKAMVDQKNAIQAELMRYLQSRPPLPPT